MHPAYDLADVSAVLSPSLVLFPELIRKNIARVVEMAGGPERLRPHVKTHKTREIVRLLLAAGVGKHKCATIAEAEMLASAGAPDVLIAYPLVGPNLARLVALIRAFPNTAFSTTIDDPDATRALSAALSAAGATAGVVLDLDVGQHRTGVPVGDAALALYKLAGSLPGFTLEGFQLYDGHNHQPDRGERERAVRAFLAPVLDLRAKCEAAGLPVPRLVCGGTPTFPVYAALTDVPGVECSPGTFVLHDAGYGPKYPDLTGITPAAVLVTRVVSRPTPDRVTLDLGNKAVAADPLLEKRVSLLDFPEYKTVGHNEEHLIVETAGAANYKPGDVVFALPGHICPTVALHKEVLVAEGGKVVGKWTVAARDRVLTV
ncbi:D-threonine aldolase, metal-activated pyridoxal enzyme OS=Planctomyces maris DSM 8797 GN=PM8797T_04985 PE=4 SV=1: Ala_racemase_N: D-ser_dehydrat [Gemmataceae bacterium]|nr:D-threonine aldolase, metal-activated pyridoxal enzyme OS=Planctomyces maris DSM 8797 GN=PM8797T_04985 PE=4 SV=1: Ala_racemase_N: D-ser_dehydrat [Gemmataceae bacterium]VTU00508.1 D-threonine aldolase, metal-activated pyridoxal enzyme OS=Planctomyces maris DSM 8797 GN=PM8797T_04985 PE=4 SV=1: Ala_racemase_N: D-ser_dehydrat [Gemmataceae bacterium]